MAVIDLTMPFASSTPLLERMKLHSATDSYTGMIYHFRYNSMSSTYLDLPGHIENLEDGRYAVNLDPADWFRKPAMMLRFKPPVPGEYGITADDLKKTLGDRKLLPWVFINAQGNSIDGHTPKRLIYLTLEAVDYLCDNGVKVLFSDVWESRRLEGVFLKFFRRKVCAVCNMKDIDQLPADRDFTVSICFLPYPDAVTQFPIRLLAEV